VTDTIRLAAALEIQAAAGEGSKSPRVSILAYSGGPMKPPGWPPVVIDLAGADVSGDIPILAGHGENLDDIAGQGRAEVRAGRLHIDGPLTEATPSGQKVIALARSGVSLQASVGFSPEKREHIPAGQTLHVNGRTLKAPDGGLTLIRSGRLREVSLLPVGADPGTRVNIVARKDHSMSTPTAPHETTPPVQTSPANDPREHVDRIEAAFRGLGLQDASLQSQAAELRLNCLAGKIDLGDVNAALVDILRRDRELSSVRDSRGQGPAIHAGRRGVSQAAVLEGMILARMGREALGEKVLGADVMQQARDQRPLHIMDVIRACIQADGREVPRDANAMIRAGFSSMSLPTALGNAANKLAMEAYQEAPATWRSFCAIKSANDFKEHTGIRLNHLGELEQLAPDGEIVHGTANEATYPYRVDTYARQLRLTRTAIVNDDLGLFDDTGKAFGRQAARKLNDLVYSVLLAAGSFFSEDNGNLLDGAEYALAGGPLAAAMRMIREQTGAAGELLDIVPKVLLVPGILEQTGKGLLLSDSVQLASDASGPTGNTLKNVLRLEVEPRLGKDGFHANASETGWYVFAGPADAAMIVAFLNGQENPTVEFFGLDSDPNTLGASWRVYQDFGAAMADSKAGVFANGTG